MKHFLLPCLLCCFWITVPAQNYLPVIHRFSIEDGLPHRQVNCILEDRRGFIWVATNGGVARFDGLRFKIFNKADNGLSTDHVHWILEDAAGNLWLISRANTVSVSGIASVDILDPVSGQILPFDQYIKEKPPVPLENLNNRGICIPSGSSGVHSSLPGTLFFGTRNPGGWASWHPATGWKQVVVPSISDLTVLSITPQNGVLGLFSTGKLHHILVETDAAGKVLRHFQATPGNQFAKMLGGAENPERVFAMEYDKRVSQAKYWEIKPGADKTRLPVPIPKSTRSWWDQTMLLELENGNLWLTETEIFNKKGERLLDLLTQFPAFNNRYIENFLRNRNGGVWLGTAFGLELIEVRKDHFRRFLFDENALGGRGISCRGIFQKDKKLWINTEGPDRSQCAIDLATGRVIFEQKDGSAYGLASDAGGNMWCGQLPSLVNRGLLARVDPASGKALEAFPFKNNVLWTIFPAKPDLLWVGTGQGLVFFNNKTRQVSKPDTHRFPELEKASIVYIGRDRSRGVWLCSSSGFYKMTAEGQIAERYWSGGTGNNWLPYDDFYHFYEDKEGVFWLGTVGAGLLRWDPKTGEKQLFFRKNGLLNGFVYAVYEDDFGHLWLPTDLGIAQFDKKNLSVRRTWLPADGVTQNEFNRTSHFQGDDGTLYFGGLNGVTAFHPKDFYGSRQTTPEIPFQETGKKLVVSDFFLFSGKTEKLENHTVDLLASGEITMQPADRYFQLEFALLDYFSPQKVTYAYKIEGVDADWSFLSEPLLRMSSLPYGNHRLKIRAQSADGAWAENELDFSLTVLRPLYLRWWFLVLVAGAILAGSFYINRFQLRRSMAEKETQRLQELDAFKTRFFTNISHEFRTPLTVILGMLDPLKKYASLGAQPKVEQTAEMIRRNSQQLLNLVNQLLDLARLEAGKLQLLPSNGDFVAFLKYQLESFQSYAQSRSIQLHYRSETPHLEMAFDHEKTQAILVNLISNALKFTPEGGQIELVLQTEPPNDTQAPKQIILTVSDTGIGIPEGQLGQIFDRFYQVVPGALTPFQKGVNGEQLAGTGIGLALVQEFVKLMQGEIEVKSSQGKGTSFRITLPFTPPIPHLQTIIGSQAEKQVTPAVTENLMGDEQWPLLLIVEDNPDVQFYIAECVRSEYRVTFAENGAEGIQKAIEQIPDIIISDVMMPEKDGFELCETLKNDELTSHIPIVLLTARADVESRIAGLKRGADDYLAKPFEPAELEARLANLIQLRRRLQQRYAAIPQMPAPSPDPGLAMEDAFLLKIREIVERHLSDSDFEILQLEQALGMSRSQVFRKVKALTGASPSIFIRSIRLHKAKALLLDNQKSIAEVAYEVGFSAPTYFAKTFLETFGKTPTEWRQAGK